MKREGEADERVKAAEEGIVTEVSDGKVIEQDEEVSRGVINDSLQTTETRGVERERDIKGEREVDGAATCSGMRVAESSAREGERGTEEARIGESGREGAGEGAWRMCQISKTTVVNWLLNSRRNKILFTTFLIAGLMLTAVVAGSAVQLSPRGTISIAELLRRVPLIDG